MTLEQRVLDFVAANPGLTSREIARGVTARHESVLDVLSSEAFSASPRDMHPSDRAQVYTVADGTGEQPGTVASGLVGGRAALSGRRCLTQCDQILLLLLNGREWSSEDLHRRVFCVLHSRIAELRRKLRPYGFDVQHTGGGSGTAVHWYRLVGTSEGEAVADGAARVAAASPSGAPATDASPESVAHARALPAGASVQIQIGAAA